MSQQAAHQSRFRSVFHTNPGHREPMGLTDSEKHGGSRPAQEPGQLPTHNGNARQGRNGSVYNHNGHKVSKGIEPDGESGRRGFHPIMFPLICARSSSRVSMITNILWPFTIAAFILHYTTENHLWVFICAYLGLVPAANLLGFAAQELARKLPTVVGVLVECLCGALVELILFIVLIVRHTENTIIKDAIVGSLLANLLLCLGACFFIGGVFTKQQHLHEAITEVGCNLLFLCGVGLSIPTIFYQSLNNGSFDTDLISDLTLSISHATAIVLLVAYVLWIFFQASSHHGLYEDLYRSDELADNDRDKDLAKKKLTLTECIAAIVIGALFVCFMAVFLVEQLPYMHEERGVSDLFLGIVLLPLVEKAAEGLVAVDESYDNAANLALAHVLGSSLSTALLNAPLAVLISWGLGQHLDLNLGIFQVVTLILAILLISSVLRDGHTDYLEGILLILVYILVAISAFWYPSLPTTSEAGAH